MKRLTDKDTNKACFDTWELCGLDSVCKRDCYKPTPCKIPKIICRLAELEDKLESGQLVELPCKVGDAVYCIDYECVHTPTKQKIKYSLSEGIVSNLEEQLHYSSAILFQKVCFTDKSQAEARLKELKEKL